MVEGRLGAGGRQERRGRPLDAGAPAAHRGPADAAGVSYRGAAAADGAAVTAASTADDAAPMRDPELFAPAPSSPGPLAVREAVYAWPAGDDGVLVVGAERGAVLAKL